VADESVSGAADAEGTERLPAIDLSTFVLSLSTTALYQLGLVLDPANGQRAEPDLVLAQQTISTLEMLRLKTRGNLEPDEMNLFDSLLYELRVRFVEVKDGATGSGASSGGAGDG
jgi:hypothetical protein